MKGTRIRVTVLLAGVATAGLLPQSAAQAPKEQAPERRIVLVAGNDPWTETDIEIYPGDRVTFNGAGEVCFSGAAKDSCQGPAGWGREDYANSWPDDYHQCEDPMSDANHASLIGSIGGGVFYIGPETTVTNEAGALRLGINDCTFEGDYGNSGQYSVVIRIVRGKPPR